MQQQLPNDVLWLELDDSILKAPRNGRVQYRVAEPGEVLGAGGRVLNNMVDLSDVYMTFFCQLKPLVKQP